MGLTERLKMSNTKQTRIEKLEAFVKKMWSCDCVRRDYDIASNGKPMYVDQDAAKYGEVLIELKKIIKE
jgi:hypothetical protein